MYVLSFVIVALIAFVSFTTWSRRKVYGNIDRLETWKTEIMNRPVSDEIAKIKGLHISGETEERFESWREEWDDILAKQLPDIEEKLFDVEELTNKYRFQKAKRYISNIEKELDIIENRISDMLTEINDLVNSEEQNRNEIEDVKHTYHETKKRLWMQKGALGQAGHALERTLEEMGAKFREFEYETEEGNYFQARDILLQLQENISQVNELIEEIPKLHVKIETDIPGQLQELESGLHEMEESGYHLAHFSFALQVPEMRRRLMALLPLLDHLRMEEVREPLEHIEQEIENIYEKLEEEALSRQYVERDFPKLYQRVEKLETNFDSLDEEMEEVKMNYHLPDEAVKQQLKVEKWLKELKNQRSVIEDSIEKRKQSFTALKAMVYDFASEVTSCENQVQEALDSIRSLRSDEIQAKETLAELKQKLFHGQRELQKSNVPGVPQKLLEAIQEGEKSLMSANEKLDETPLSMEEVSYYVKEASEHIEHCLDLLYDTIEKANLVERVIQYGNRYRSRNDELNIKLLQAEECFRNFQYDEALEVAVKAIEPFDAHVLSKVDEGLQEHVYQ
ncbi:septation ring formation regulator EzrA [Texcoconibacillus texcoconensis]|uniref:Septation ring formation regulator EzrA n=1 Tax=Texcoconibacillus texcoconensis TaxID=1095777 RepID=A0A840QN43_9BACI|nr:septation ring formation regulator EzrA [Texcoconibacillus texcoconensis]MBB5172760.1 septation ring formation regulator [Texcoconibacillus texcoconensis]